METKKTISIIGLGYVGLPLAVEFGKKYLTYGFDISRTRISELNQGVDRTGECSGDEIKSSRYLEFTNDADDLSSTNFYICTVPTPVDKSNKPDLTPLELASGLIGHNLSPGDMVIYESTVFPGATEEFCVPILEAKSGLKFNVDFFCGYSPERINPGDSERSLTTIPKVVSGSTPNAAKIIKSLYDTILESETWLAPSIKVAEASKVIENAQRDLNIAFVNELSIIFERMGIDTKDVLDAAATKWNFMPFAPGMVGGHCIGVDPYYLTHKAEQMGYHSQVILAGRRINDNMAKYAARCVLKRLVTLNRLSDGPIVTVLGATFKENCPDVRNSQVFKMISEFRDWGLTVQISDPLASKEDVAEMYGETLTPIEDLKRADAIVISVAHDSYCALTPMDLEKLASSSGSVVVADLKSMFDRKELEKIGFNVFRF